MHPEYAERILTTVQTGDPGPQAILQTAYGALIRGDYDTFADSLAEDAELHIAGFEPINGTWRGRKEVAEAARGNFALLTGQQPQIDAMVKEGDSIAVLLRESGLLKSTGQPYRVRVVQWFTFAQGKIQTIEEIVAAV